MCIPPRSDYELGGLNFLGHGALNLHAPFSKITSARAKIPAVRDCQRNILHAHFVSTFPRDALQLQRRLSAGLADYFDVAPAHSRAPAGAQSFHRSFFGGKASGVTFEFIPMAFAVGGLREA